MTVGTNTPSGSQCLTSSLSNLCWLMRNVCGVSPNAITEGTLFVIPAFLTKTNPPFFIKGIASSLFIFHNHYTSDMTVFVASSL